MVPLAAYSLSPREGIGSFGVWYCVYMPNKHHKVATISATADDEAVAWSALDHFYRSDPEAPIDHLVVAGGVLLGSEDMVTQIISVINPSHPVTEVEVLPPGVRYAFTENRDTPADVAAAMVYAGSGRTFLDTSGWDALYASGQLGDEDAVPDDAGADDPDDSDDAPVVY